MCPCTGQETATQVRSFGPSWHVACTAAMRIRWLLQLQSALADFLCCALQGGWSCEGEVWQ